MLCNSWQKSVLEQTGLKFPTATKTGTTIVGLVFNVRADHLCGSFAYFLLQNGVCLGADTERRMILS